MTEGEAIELARSHFLRSDNRYGCAETVFMTLKEAYGLPQASDSSTAMALNGGIAYSGGICGALTGAALAVGLLAGQRLEDHRQAKRTARKLIARLMVHFEAAQGCVNCRDLIGLDIRDEAQHLRFITSGLWRTRCMQAIEFAVRELYSLREMQAWERAVQEVNP